MTRHLLNLLTALSLLLCVAVCVLWVRSHESPASLRRLESHRDAAVSSWKGMVCAQATDEDERVSDVEGWALQRDHQPPLPLALLSDPPWNRLGFSAGRERVDVRVHASPVIDYTYTLTWLTVPFWALVVPFLLLPVIRLSHWQRSCRRPAPGLCPGCGYDLTGNVSGVCPECGRAAP